MKTATALEKPILWKPQPKQQIALSCPATELFYGGAAGGGKSDFLLMDALNCLVAAGPTYRGIIFRQSRTQLTELLRRANELYLPIGAIFRAKHQLGSNIYIFPNHATIEFSYLESDKDVEIYQGQQFSYVGFDELGAYPSDFAWNYMQSRLRNASGGVKSYIRGTGNPGGRGQGWIKQRFMNGKLPNHIYTKTVQTKSGVTREFTSCFIPSSLYDNKILMENDPDYEVKLLMLPPHLRDALLKGNWDVFAGQVFSFNQEEHVRAPFIMDARYWYKFCSMDWGFGKPYDLQFWAVNKDGRMYMYREIYGCKPGEYNVGVREGSDSLASRAMEIARNEGVSVCVADPAIWNKQDDAPSVAETFSKYGWEMVKANNDRINGLIQFNQMLVNTDENGIPMLTVSPNCEGFIRTIPSLTPDPNRQEDIDTKLEDHPYDAARYAVMSDYAQHANRYIVDYDYRHRHTDDDNWNPLSF